jgi:hypothetical protein
VQVCLSTIEAREDRAVGQKFRLCSWARVHLVIK